MTNSEIAALLRRYTEPLNYQQIIGIGVTPEDFRRAEHEGAIIMQTAGSVHGGCLGTYTANPYARVVMIHDEE